MINHLPDDLLQRARRILLPLVATVEDREALLTEAFYTHDPILYGIDRSGSPKVFAVRCIKSLLDYGCLTTDEHALARLLLTARIDCGVDKHAEIDELVAITNMRCGESIAPTVPSMPPAPPVTSPLQGISTPQDQRTPTVFVSYSHEDAEFANRLIADLNAAGHACWIDTARIKSGDEWVRSITEGINNSYAFISVVSEAANASTWVRREFLWAEYKHKRIFPVMAQACELAIYLMERQAVFMYEDYPQGLAALLQGLPQPGQPAERGSLEADQEAVAEILAGPEKPLVTQRRLELDYLEQLRAEVLFDLEKYTPLGGESQLVLKVRHGQSVDLAVMRPEFEHLARHDEQRTETRRFDDAVAEILRIKRAVLLGEPGAGKTTTFLSLAGRLAAAAQQDPTAPLPLFVRLGRWTDPNQSLTDFIAAELGQLGSYLPRLLESERAVPLLDGMNEIPVSQREAKYAQIRAFITSRPDWLAVVSCRERDYTVDLKLDRITVKPLDALRVREFVGRYLGQGTGETLFWQIAGGEALKLVWEKWERAGASFLLFWEANDVPRGNPDVYHATTTTDDDLWRKHVCSPGSLMQLAYNPYMLAMLTQVYVARGDLPANRGDLFREFVITLLAREKILTRDPVTHQPVLNQEARNLQAALAEVAFAMQIQRGAEEDASAQTVLPLATIRQFMDPGQVYLAASASLLDVGEADVRFTHQLLQEYFAAVALDGRIFGSSSQGDTLNATDLWPPEYWWEPASWEEAFILLAGLYSDDCSPVVEWLAQANPEVAAQCVMRSGAALADATRERLRTQWIPRLTDLKTDPQPQARAAIGRALGLTGWDDRHGVGILERDGLRLPDIDWVLIPGGEFIYQDGDKLTLPAFEIARYPITYAQFQCFVDAPDYGDDRWWIGMPEEVDVYATTYRVRELGEQVFKYWNHPRETVSWYQAVAFCRWLSARLGYKVSLPTEQQWERAARGTDGRVYPYEGEFEATKGNTSATGIRQTSAVGIFPQGASPEGVLDMSGNVWQWCANKYEDPEDMSVDESNARRVVRGGAWSVNLGGARAVYRNWDYPDDRLNLSVGFRVCRPPSLG